MFSLICGSTWWGGFAWGLGAGLAVLAVAVVAALIVLESTSLY